MADTKTTGLTAGTPIQTDIFPYVSDPAGSPTTKKATIASVKTLVQTVNTQSGAVVTGSTTIPFDDTIPQITEGDEYLTVTITPKDAANVLEIDVCLFISCLTGVRNLCVALFQDATANALACGQAVVPTAGYTMNICFRHRMVAGTTSATTFRVRAGVDTSGTCTLNGSSGARKYGGVQASSITVKEIAP